jgi:DNA sulfur modification protein DndC
MFQEVNASLHRLHLEDERPWLVGFSGGKDSNMLALLSLDVALSIPPEQRKRPISVLCTDTHVEITAIVDMVESTLDRMLMRSEQDRLNIDANLLKPVIGESFWINIIGRGYPSPDQTFRLRTQRMEINLSNALAWAVVGRGGEAILPLRARRAESSTFGESRGA